MKPQRSRSTHANATVPPMSTAAEDAAWFARARDGDEEAFEQLFRRYASSLREFAYSYVRSRELAEEVVQDLFIALWERRQTLTIRGAVASYLYGAVRNRSLSAKRVRRGSLAVRVPLSDDTQSPTPPVEEEIAAAELATAVSRIVGRLPKRCQEVFRLNRYHHLSYGQVAQVLGLSVKTVEIHMARAFRELRARIKLT
jgi:RNA polymerase sigma-70 factor (ECF subfamily)